MVRSWLQLVTILVLLIGLYIFTNLYIALLALAIIILLILSSFALLWFMRGKLQMTLESSWATYKQEEGIIQIKIKNKSMLPISKVKCVLLFHNQLTGDKQTKEIYFMIKGKDELEIPLYFSSEHVGKINIHIQSIQIYDYLHLFVHSMNLDVKGHTYIIPIRFPIHIMKQDSQIGMTNGMQMLQQKNDNTGSHIIGMKEYKEGEDAKHIHWKLMTKFNLPIVKEFSEPINKHILVLYDTYASSAQEINTRIELFISVSNALIDQNYEHTIGWYDVETKRMKMEQVSMIEQLTLLQSTVLEIHHNEERHPNFNQMFDTLQAFSHVFFITSEESQAIEYIKELRHVTTLVYVKNTNDIKGSYENNVPFSADTIQEDVSYLPM